MAFVIDGSQWAFDGLSEFEVTRALETILERLATAAERGERVSVGEDLQTRHVLAELSIWSLWSADSPVKLSFELRQELSAHLMRASCYLDEQEWPDGLVDPEVSIGGSASACNVDVAWAHHSVLNGRAIACIGWKRKGKLQTRSSAGLVEVHFVADEPSHVAFFRHAIDIERDTEESLQRFAPHAFPDLFFLDGVWRGLSHFEGGYQEVRQELRRTLAVLNDHGQWIFSAPPPALTEDDRHPGDPSLSPDRTLIKKRFKSRGLDVTPENSDVHDHKRCRTARERAIGERTLYLEWHVKLSPHINRVHIHPPCSESDNRVIIGIFHRHLPLPGD